MLITYLGNHSVSYSSENHHCRSLESLGHQVVRLQESQATSEEILEKALKSDIFIWTKTWGWETPGKLTMFEVLHRLRKAKIKTVTYHLDLIFGLQRQNEVMNSPFWNMEYFFTVDKLMSDWLNKHTDTKGFYLPPGVFQEEVYKAPQIEWKHDVIFVGSKGYHSEYQYRPQLIDWLQATYGDKFGHYGGDGLGTIRERALNELYANTKVAVGDTLCLGFTYPWYFSDRLVECPGRFGFQIFPYIKGLENMFEIGKEIITYTYGNFTELKEKIDYYIEHDDEREKIRHAGFERAKKDHTYINRWKIILETVNETNQNK